MFDEIIRWWVSKVESNFLFDSLKHFNVFGHLNTIAIFKHQILLNYNKF